MSDGQANEITRRFPRQRRAQKTVETILEATAQILIEEGSERLTTNYLAERAGFTVGTIYQYFPNREAIVLALVERQREDVARRIQAMMAEARTGSAEERIRAIVHVLHDAFNVHRMPERRLLDALLRMAAAHGIPMPTGDVARALAAIWSAEAGSVARLLDESEVFVLTASLFEVLRQATLQGSALLGTAAFEEAIVRMVIGFLREITVSRGTGFEGSLVEASGEPLVPQLTHPDEKHCP